MSKELAEALRDAMLHLDPAQATGTLKRARVALARWDTRHLRLATEYRVEWEVDTFNASTPLEAAQEAWRTMRRVDSQANTFTVRGRDGTITEVDLSYEH